MSLSHSTGPFSSSRQVSWTRLALLPALALALPWAAWRAGADPVPSRLSFEDDLRACQHRLAQGYAASGIHVSADDARTIHSACERLAREHLGLGPVGGRD